MPCIRIRLMMKRKKKIRKTAQKSEVMEPTMQRIMFRTPCRNFTTCNTLKILTTRASRMNFRSRLRRRMRRKLMLSPEIAIWTSDPRMTMRSKRFQPQPSPKSWSLLRTLRYSSMTIQMTMPHSAYSNASSLTISGGAGPLPSVQSMVVSTKWMSWLVWTPASTTLASTTRVENSLKATWPPSHWAQVCFGFVFSMGTKLFELRCWFTPPSSSDCSRRPLYLFLRSSEARKRLFAILSAVFRLRPCCSTE
mmetsp:Transcript_93401/g.241427  ORF Transcript_93401/g.241427 Transcript_93401/m.241427 type:complete len:250 (-) Transcript_93401:126-875(-)